MDQIALLRTLANAPTSGAELARTFGADESYRYVNGVLDKVAKDLRPHER